MREIAHRTYTDEDQQFFASVSGDCNPMHVSLVDARRLITGRQVVHGIHLLTTALEHWSKSETVVPVSVACSFSNPVSVGDRVLFTQTDRSDGTFVIEASVSGLSCARIVIGTTPAGSENAPLEVQSQNAPGAVPVALEPLGTPLDQPPESHVGKTYAIDLKCDGVANRFPNSCSYLGEKAVAALLGLSYFVGMVCPGLHSIFSSLALRMVPAEGGDNALAISVGSYDSRFGLFNCSVSGCVHGTVKAFLRPAPQQQPTLCEIARSVDPGEFKGIRSLVIGGSRGLGEATAKILAAGGGNVIITFATGRIEAGKICDEINSAGLGRCEAAKLDLTADSLGSLPVDVNSLDAVFYFPTPRIARKKSALFGRELFQEFCAYYIDKFHDLCAYLDANLKQGRTTVYYPSSVFVAERPSGMTEYAMAKAAGEVLVDEVNRYAKRVSIVATRLPRLSTDQTASILRLPMADNLETLLPVVRSVVENVRSHR